MGCISGKTGHTDSDTESAISTISYRSKSYPYDEYWNEEDYNEEFQEELGGKKDHGGKKKKLNKEDLGTERKKSGLAGKFDLVGQKSKEAKKEKDSKEKQIEQAGQRNQADGKKKVELNGGEDEKNENVNQNNDLQESNETELNKISVENKEIKDKKEDKNKDIKEKQAMNSDKGNMGNKELLKDKENKEEIAINDPEALSDDHHVHWQDEKKPKNAVVRAISRSAGVRSTPRSAISRTTPRSAGSRSTSKDLEVKLMPTPSERVLSAHTRRGSLKHPGEKDRRGSKHVDIKNGKVAAQSEQPMENENKTGADVENKANGEQGAEGGQDIEQEIRDEGDPNEEEDIESFDDDDWSTSQMTDRAPSLSLWYDDNFAGDILTTQIYVPSFGLSKHTYYCCLQWNSGRNGGGYCGIQDHENGRNYIFSIWDPIDEEGKIKPVYIGPGTTCEPFGGEGTGLKSWNFDLGWEPDCWYTLVTRRWDHEGHTRYGFWVKHHLECFWTHIVTVDFPMPGIYYDTWTCSFLEDWEGMGYRVRRAHLRNGFKRKPNGQWVPFDKAVFGMVKELSSRRFRQNFDAGTFDEMFFMQCGGETIPTEGVTDGSCFYTVADDKPTEVPISCVLTTVTGSEMVWEVSEGSVPQFRYAIKVDGELYKQEINSEMRVCKFSSPPQALVEIFVEDILGRTANARFVVREKLKCKQTVPKAAS